MKHPRKVFFLGLLFASGCSFELAPTTSGEKGNLEFSYSVSDRVLSESLSRPVLQGSMVSVKAEGVSLGAGATARLPESSMATIAFQELSCSCGSERGDAFIRCPAGTTKACKLSVDVETRGAGDPRLEVVDLAGNVLDQATMHVRPAARLEVTLKQGGVAVTDGYQATRGSALELESSAYDASGASLAFTKHGISFDYKDPSVVGPTSFELFGASNVERMIAKAPGNAVVRVFASGAETWVRLRITP